MQNKAEFLKEHGWTNAWSDDYWLDVGETDYERAGIRTDEAYIIEKKRELQRIFDVFDNM